MEPEEIIEGLEEIGKYVKYHEKAQAIWEAIKIVRQYKIDKQNERLENMEKSV